MQDAACPAPAWARHTWVLPVPPEQPWCEPMAPRPWASSTGWGGISPHGSPGEFWHQRFEMLFRGDRSWRTGSHVDTGSTNFFRGCGGGGGHFVVCILLTPGEVASGGWG